MGALARISKAGAADRLAALAERLEPDIQRAFLETVRRIRSEWALEQIEELLLRGRVAEALERVSYHATWLADQVVESYVAAARDVTDQLALEIGEQPSFDRTNERAVAQMRQMRDRIVTDFSTQQFEATRGALVEGVRDAVPPRELARRFRDSVGLAPNQEAAVDNYRRLLREGSSQALDRELRDRRFDRRVEDAVDGSRPPLTDAEIDRMVDRYRENFITYRSEAIARSEALPAVHSGAHEMYRQAAEAGAINPDRFEREWSAANDDRVRESHAAMDGQRRGLNEPFLSGLGNELMFPGDPSAPLEDTMQCRCSVLVRIRID